VVICQLRVGEMIPSAGITIEQSGCFRHLFAILTPLTLESVMSIAESFFVKREQLAQGVHGKVPFCVFLFVNYR